MKVSISALPPLPPRSLASKQCQVECTCSVAMVEIKFQLISGCLVIIIKYICVFCHKTHLANAHQSNTTCNKLSIYHT